VLAEETEGCVVVPVGSGSDGGLSLPACPTLPSASFGEGVMGKLRWEKGKCWVLDSSHPPQRVFSQLGTEAKILMLFPS